MLRAGGAASGSIAAALLALALASAGAVTLAAILMVVAVGFGCCTRHWLGLAARSRIGARSEDEVRRVLRALEAQGWRVRHSLRWRGSGDIESVATAPAGIAFAIETKTRSYDDRHLRVVREQADWLRRGRRRWCRVGALPVLCIVCARGVERWEAGVLVVSIDRLTQTLQRTAHPNDLRGSLFLG
jgi:Nuclease-related domain